MGMTVDGDKLEAIWITAKAKAELDSKKIIPREAYYSVVNRVLFGETISETSG